MPQTTDPQPSAPRRFRPTLETLDARLTPAVTFRFDYSLDTSGFFADPAARAALDRAAASISSRLGDSLAPIVPGGGNTWEAVFENPVTERVTRLPNLVVGPNEVLVFVAGGELTGGALAITGPGAGLAEGAAAWRATVATRGQPAEPLDTGPWGGMVAFDTAVPWNFGEAPPARNQYDFFAVAQHELFHVLGFTSGNPSFQRFVTPGGFVGPGAMTVYGGPVPLETDRRPGHWDDGVVSDGRLAGMTPTDVRGFRASLTTLDWAGLADTGWSVAPDPTPVLAPPPPTAPPGTGTPRVAVGTGEGSEPVVTWLDRSGRTVSSFRAFAPDFTGGVRVATADFNADGIRDVVVGTGPGAATRVRVLSGVDRSELFAVSPFEAAFTGGVFVSAGDLDGDGAPELVITPDEGGGPRVRVFSGANFKQLADFFGINDPNFRGGARTAVGDVDGDDTSDLLVAAGFGGGPRVSGYDGPSVTANRPAQLFGDFFAFETTLRNGVYLAAGDVDGDGVADVIAGAGPGGGPRVTAFSGKPLTQSGRREVAADLFAGDVNGRGGVRVAAVDLDGDTRTDIVGAAGYASGSWVTGYPGAALTGPDEPDPAFDYTVYPEFFGGVFVG